MGFESENRTILDIYNKAACYIVPRYQRGYVWNGKQVRTLIRKLLTKFGFLPYNSV